MTQREKIIEALQNASELNGIIKMSTDFRDELVRELESRPERIILRIKNWIRMDDELLSKTKSIVNEQLENGDKTIIVPNVFDVVYVPEGLEVQMLQ